LQSVDHAANREGQITCSKGKGEKGIKRGEEDWEGEKGIASKHWKI